jgi:hypothetical protein
LTVENYSLFTELLLISHTLHHFCGHRWTPIPTFAQERWTGLSILKQVVQGDLDHFIAFLAWLRWLRGGLGLNYLHNALVLVYRVLLIPNQEVAK